MDPRVVDPRVVDPRVSPPVMSTFSGVVAALTHRSKGPLLVGTKDQPAIAERSMRRQLDPIRRFYLRAN